MKEGLLVCKGAIQVPTSHSNRWYFFAFTRFPPVGHASDPLGLVELARNDRNLLLRDAILTENAKRLISFRLGPRDFPRIRRINRRKNRNLARPGDPQSVHPLPTFRSCRLQLSTLHWGAGGVLDLDLCVSAPTRS